MELMIMQYPARKMSMIGMAMSFFLVAGGANAYDLGGIKIHGFLTVGATVSDVDATYLRGTTDDINFDEDSALGLQVIAPIGDKFTLQGQLLTNGSREPDTGFNVDLDWAFASYQFTDNFVLRGGKIRFPISVLSEVNEVGYTYPWVRTPRSVYGAVPFNAVDGVDAIVSFGVGEDLELALQPFAGDFSEKIAFGADRLTLDLDGIVGFNATLGNDIFSVRAGMFDTEVSIQGTPFQDIETTHYGVGAKVETDRVVSYFEYFKTDFKDGEQVGFGDSRDGWYGTFGYRFGKFLPHVTIGQRDSASPGFTIGDTYDDLTLGLRYEVSDSSALKFEWTQSKPTNGTVGEFDQTLGDDEHGNIFSIAFDLVF
jgi:hypothetical protein